MAERACRAGLKGEHIVLEERSTSTWENVAFARPLIGDAGFVVLVSEGMHARRALGYWRRQFPDLRIPVRVDPTYRPLDHFWIKVPSALRHLLEPLRRMSNH